MFGELIRAIMRTYLEDQRESPTLRQSTQTDSRKDARVEDRFALPSLGAIEQPAVCKFDDHGCRHSGFFMLIVGCHLNLTR